jgi:hypothetical protein
MATQRKSLENIRNNARVAGAVVCRVPHFDILLTSNKEATKAT